MASPPVPMASPDPLAPLAAHNPVTTPANPPSESQRPPSAISSHMTEDDLEAPSELSSQRGAASQPHVSRREPPLANSLGIPRSSLNYERPGQGSSRPQSSASRVSRTHVPSLAAHGFFRPMSSQRLQAQRGARPSTKGQSVASEDGHSDNTSQANRQSIGSNPTTIRPPPFIHQQENEAPPSRGTEFTDPAIPDRTISNASPTGNTTVRSLGESVRLLHHRTGPQPTHLDITKSYADAAPPQKSPRSFRSGFRLSSRNEPQRHEDVQGHERLSSGGSSPRLTVSKPPPIPTQSRARNHEYFQGNTVFFLGGRFQNSRDRPINIATGIFVIVPTVLFFVYS
jgi:palmitoyltransferase ZDHHC9/14/18